MNNQEIPMILEHYLDDLMTLGLLNKKYLLEIQDSITKHSAMLEKILAILENQGGTI